jgi:hypothetical protein
MLLFDMIIIKKVVWSALHYAMSTILYRHKLLCDKNYLWYLSNWEIYIMIYALRDQNEAVIGSRQW